MTPPRREVILRKPLFSNDLTCPKGGSAGADRGLRRRRFTPLVQGSGNDIAVNAIAVPDEDSENFVHQFHLVAVGDGGPSGPKSSTACLNTSPIRSSESS